MGPLDKPVNGVAGELDGQGAEIHHMRVAHQCAGNACPANVMGGVLKVREGEHHPGPFSAACHADIGGREKLRHELGSEPLDLAAKGFGAGDVKAASALAKGLHAPAKIGPVGIEHLEVGANAPSQRRADQRLDHAAHGLPAFLPEGPKSCGLRRGARAALPQECCAA